MSGITTIIDGVMGYIDAQSEAESGIISFVLAIFTSLFGQIMDSFSA